MEQTARKREKAPERRRARKPAAFVPGVRMDRRNLCVLGISGGVIVLGFIALALGSKTLAPLLLVAGFLVGIPWGIMTREKARPGEGGQASGG
jgi:hypothetical protein